jgi:2-hydroxy-3-keto-5-methylthiopentenyl-1-phosphate phosphatase
MDYFLPIEHDHLMSIEEKTPYMVDWWQKTLDLISKTEITQEKLKEIVETSPKHTRNGCNTFFSKLEENEIPLLIFSAGLGDTL